MEMKRITKEPPPPPLSNAAAAAARLRRKIISGQFDEENPFVLISSVFLVHADEGVSFLVVDRIGDIYRNLPRRADVIVTTVGARHKCQQAGGRIRIPNTVAPTEQPSVPKRKTQKRKRKLILCFDDEFVEQPAAKVAGETVVEQEPVVEVPGETVIEGIGKTHSEPAVADVSNTGMSTADDVDTIIEQVLAETAQIGPYEEEQDVGGLDVGEQAAPKADEFEQWLNLSYEEMETEAVEQSADEAMSLEDIFMTIPVECPLPSANVEITKITLGKSISIPGVDEGDWYKADLPKIPTADKGKGPLMQRDPVKGNPTKEQFSLILADIEEAQNDNNALSLALKAVRTQNVILSTDLEATRKEVKDIKATLSKDFDDKLADIRNELLEFRVDTQGQLASLSTHLAELIAFLTKGSDDKKGEDSSSRRPQPPPDNQSRPSVGSGGSGNRADEQSRLVGSGSRGGSQRRGDRSGSSKRGSYSSGGGPFRRSFEDWLG
ncbi:hypothetical protein F511_20884 [Dorcoceras hygrometricum]|uniref:Uncharacterized protein n=1 Tax=Dorcoceras hygrometricum TaxID=472368 RepID=A0A2Z7D8D5_9LAMI|nr:hypothetical protein F511_20884 [Dorcoceras hygrometricum]